MPVHPADFDALISRATPRWFRWSSRLVAVLRSLAVVTPEGGQVVATAYTGGGTLLTVPRPIPAYRLVRSGAGGIPAASATTGEWGQGTVTDYETTKVGPARRSVLSTRTLTAYNDKRDAAVPANTDVMCIEQGGDLMVIGWVCLA